jgi:hypothetical protein
MLCTKNLGLLAGAAAFVSSALFAGCGDEQRDYGSAGAGAGGVPLNIGGSGEEAGGAPEPTGGGDGAGGDTTGSGGSPMTSAGAGPEAGAGGVGGASSDCPDGYENWLTSGFAFPDGDVLGVADYPSLPWVPSGALSIASGRVTGTGAATISQGRSYDYDGGRVRFRARFSDSSQAVTVAINTAADGTGGLRLTLDAAGDLILSEGQATRGQTTFEPPATGVDWFVEGKFTGSDATVSVSTGGYPGEGLSAQQALLATSALKLSAKGVKAALRLDSSVGIDPALDELSIARCGLAAPEYTAHLIDQFERANSATLGSPEVPANASWSAGTSGTKIVDGAMQTVGDLKPVSIPLQVPLVGLRVRTTISMVQAENAYLWADVNINVPADTVHGQGLWVWAGPKETSFNTGLFVGGGEVAHPHTLAPSEKYYVEMDRDGDVAFISVRLKSFSGPILGVQYAAGLMANPEPGAYLTLSDEGGAGTRFEDIRVDSFPFEG